MLLLSLQGEPRTWARVATKTHEVDGNDYVTVIGMKLVDLSFRIEKNMEKEVDKPKCQKWWGKTSSIHSRLRRLIGLPVMTSLTDNAIHHPLWRVQRRVRLWKRAEVKRQRIKILMRKRGEETGRGSLETCQGSAPLPLSQWVHEHSRVELMRCWC